MDKRINNLRPGQSIVIGRSAKGYCTAERSGNGETLRFVRHTDSGFTVFATRTF